MRAIVTLRLNVLAHACMHVRVCVCVGVFGGMHASM